MVPGAARTTAGVIVCLTALLALLGFATPAAAASGQVSFTATLNGRNVAAISSNDPLELSAKKPLIVAVTVTNKSPKTVTVNTARVRGTVMGLAFFSYDTQVALKVPAGTTQKTTFSVGLADLAGQATGLLPTTIALLDTNSAAIASKDFTVDVNGDATSIYGVFGIAVAALTALWLVSLIVRVARRSLPGNRWVRAVQFAVAGFGVGLTLTFSVSALSLLSPNAGVWAPFVFGAGAVGFVIGYLTPGPRIVDPDEEEQFIASRAPVHAAAVGAGAPTPAIGAGEQRELEPQRPWQGEVERAPLGFAARPEEQTAERPVPSASHAASDSPDTTTTQVVPRLRDRDGAAVLDDRETTEIDRSDFPLFGASSDERDNRT